jgi:hypothetical protein
MKSIRKKKKMTLTFEIEDCHVHIQAGGIKNHEEIVTSVLGCIDYIKGATIDLGYPEDDLMAMIKEALHRDKHIATQLMN